VYAPVQVLLAATMVPREPAAHAQMVMSVAPGLPVAGAAVTEPVGQAAHVEALAAPRALLYVLAGQPMMGQPSHCHEPRPMLLGARFWGSTGATGRATRGQSIGARRACYGGTHSSVRGVPKETGAPRAAPAQLSPPTALNWPRGHATTCGRESQTKPRRNPFQRTVPRQALTAVLLLTPRVSLPAGHEKQVPLPGAVPVALYVLAGQAVLSFIPVRSGQCGHKALAYTRAGTYVCTHRPRPC
jgi:hypothetical protein